VTRAGVAITFPACCNGFRASPALPVQPVLLGIFLAANLLPPQSLLIPVYRMFREVRLPFLVSDSGSLLNTPLGVIA